MVILLSGVEHRRRRALQIRILCAAVMCGVRIEHVSSSAVPVNRAGSEAGGIERH
jgi:GrpB-like predicted nucleotidyltransferase (UPF0157 family)